jgi:putative membrane protein insertion efficiency factor
MTKLLIILIRMYQVALSPFFGQQCRFAPTCSYYAIESIQVHGPIKGFFLTIKRLSHCHPWHIGGHDPVPKSCCNIKHS